MSSGKDSHNIQKHRQKWLIEKSKRVLEKKTPRARIFFIVETKTCWYQEEA